MPASTKVYATKRIRPILVEKPTKIVLVTVYVTTGQNHFVLPGHSQPILCVLFSADGRRLVIRGLRPPSQGLGPAAREPPN